MTQTMHENGCAFGNRLIFLIVNGSASDGNILHFRLLHPAYAVPAFLLWLCGRVFCGVSDAFLRLRLLHRDRYSLHQRGDPDRRRKIRSVLQGRRIMTSSSTRASSSKAPGTSSSFIDFDIFVFIVSGFSAGLKERFSFAPAFRLLFVFFFECFCRFLFWFGFGFCEEVIAGRMLF